MTTPDLGRVERIGNTVHRPAGPWTRLEVFAAAYGLTDTAGLVDAVLTVQERGIDAVRHLAGEGHEPQDTWVAEGYLDELRARVAWSHANRHLID